MSDLPNQAIEQGATQVEKPVVPNLAEPSTKVAPLGVAEQQIISDINSNEDGNADEVLQNIAGMDSKTSIKIPPPNKKELYFNWAKDMSGRRVDFPSEEGLAWGIELTIPLNYPILRDTLKNVSGINIPDHIDTITYLDVAPQESLPKNIRNIRTQKYSFLPSQLEVLARKTISSSKNEKLQETFNVPRPTDMQRSAQIERMITEVFGNNQREKDDFNEYVSKNEANELVIVHGHGGSELIIGEQYNDGTTAEDGTPIQKKGNRIKIDEILERYNKPEKHAAILLHNCHSSDEKVIAKKVPVFMPVGHVGGVVSMLQINKAQSSVPNK